MPDTSAHLVQPASAVLPAQRTSPRPELPCPPGPGPGPGRQWLARRARAVLARRVGRELERLVRHDPRWRRGPAVTLGDGTVVDHLLVGPPGVFALACGGEVPPGERVGGPLAGAAGVQVEAQVVVVTAGGGPRTAPTGGGTVVHRDRLCSFLSTRPECLAPVTVERLHAAACDAGTWSGLRG